MPLPVDLSFRFPATAPGPVDLVFGASAPVPAATVWISGRLPALRARLQLAYDNRVPRPLTGATASRWERADPVGRVSRSRWQDTAPARTPADAAWQTGERATAALAALHAGLATVPATTTAVWTRAVATTAATESPTDGLVAERAFTGVEWTLAMPRVGGTAAIWVVLLPHPERMAFTWDRAAARTQTWHAEHHPARPAPIGRTLPWQRARPVPPGVSAPPIVTPPSGPPSRRPPVHLRFACPVAVVGTAGLPLPFGHRCAGLGASVPVLRVYAVSHSVEVVRLPGRDPIPVKQLQLATDSDAWAWEFSATLPARALDQIAPTRDGPVELEITINGVVWVLLVEGYGWRRAFGSSELTARGRSRAAWLADPYAPTRSFTAESPFTARQLAEQELVRAGLDTGFVLDWQLPDWLVPAGAWSYQGLTPLSAVLAVVSSVGGTLNAHPHERRLVARSRYLEPPWRWDQLSPELTLPLAVVSTLDLDWREKPAFNAVLVAGERQGVTGRIVRAGTAGDRPAPMVVHPLITHADAARERGTAILADTGRQARVTLEHPMLPSVGLLEPGRLVAVTEGSAVWRGLVRATRIAATWTDTLRVRQTLEIERHFL